MKLSSSIIIPTRNRLADLQSALESILNQTKLPIEVIVVDSSDGNETELLVKRFYHVFSERNVDLRYTRNDRELSLTVSRNIGVKISKGEIIFFMDDDVVLEKDYVRSIISVYETYPSALGVEGKAHNWQPPSTKIDRLIWFFKKSFFLFAFEIDRCRVLQSGNNTYPIPLTKIINCQWLSGTSSYRHSVFNNFEFDEKLKRWAYKEDEDFSYRVYRKNPDSLFITPEATYVHNYSVHGRFSERTVRYMLAVYGAYFFYKNIKQTNGAKFSFALSLFFGIAIDSLMSKGKSLKNDIKANIYMFNNIAQIKKGNLNFFDNFLSQKTH